MKTFGAILAALAVNASDVHSAPNPAYDGLAAHACVELASYADELSEIAAQNDPTKSHQGFYNLSAIILKNAPKVRMFSIVAGPNARSFGLEDANGIHGIEELVKTCSRERSCNEDVVSVARGFAFFLIEACRSDYQGNE